MKAPQKKLSGSTRQFIRQLVTGTGRFSPKQIAKREAAARRRYSRLEAGFCVT
jgi:hypothetical protein